MLGGLPGPAAAGRPPPRASLSSVASDAFENTPAEDAGGSDSASAVNERARTPSSSVGRSPSAASNPPPASVTGSAHSTDADLPKPAHLIKAEMGIVLGGERHVLVVSLADDLEAVAASWCAERGLPEKVQLKIVPQLQTRLDAALAQAYQEREGANDAPPPANDVA